jgi:hypothetical protein
MNPSPRKQINTPPIRGVSTDFNAAWAILIGLGYKVQNMGEYPLFGLLWLTG